MPLTNEDDVRDTINVPDTTALRASQITLAIKDASSRINVSDEIAERYFACYILAKTVSWDKIKSLGDGVSFEPPKPDHFLGLYNDRLIELGRSKPRKINWKATDGSEP